MIASIFNKSKPINFVIVIVVVLLGFVYANVNLSDFQFNLTNFGKEVLVFGTSVFTIFLLNFIVIKNKLTEASSFHILFYCLFLVTFPVSLISIKLLLANTFVLLALRRIISMRSQLNLKKKLFDAAFWISIATLLYFWSILFFTLIFIALFLYSDNKIKNWIVPFTGILTVLVLLIAFQLGRYGNLEAIYSNLPKLNFDFSSYNSIKHVAAITLLLSFGLWSTIFYIRSLKDKLKIFKPPHKIMVAAMLIAVIVGVLCENKNTSEFIFLFAPLSVIMSNYVDSIEENWFKEIFISILVLAPITILFL